MSTPAAARMLAEEPRLPVAPTGNPRIPTLDGWRAAAILMVTAFHASNSIWPDRPNVLFIMQFGALGVDVFFGLSGLLITKLLLEEHDRNGAICLKAFYVRRLFRVVLPCYFYLAAVWLFSGIPDRTELISSLLFYRNTLGEDYHGPYTIHLWSLAVEEHFYLLWPPVLVWATVKRGREVAIWLSVAFGLWRNACSQFFPALAGAANPLFRSDFRMDALLWGCVVAFLLHDSYAHLKGYLSRTVWAGAVLAFLLCLLYYSPLTRMWMPMLIPLLIAGTVTHPEWKLSRLLDLPPVRWLGRLSYSLYMWQLIFLVGTANSAFWWQRFPVNIVLSLITAALVYYSVERSLQRIGQRLSAGVTAEARTV